MSQHLLTALCFLSLGSTVAEAVEGPVYFGPRAAGMSWIESDTHLIHGLAVSDALVFATFLPIPFPNPNAVKAFKRLDGSEVGALPEPPGGWRFPFMMACKGNKVYVWDAGGFPGPTAVVQPTLYVYTFSGHSSASFHATLQATVDFRSTQYAIGWAADIELLPDGSVATADSIFGAIWRLDPANGSITLVVGPDSPMTTTSPPAFFPPLMTGFVPPGYTGGSIDGIPYILAGGILPGSNYLAYRGGYLYFTNAAHQAIERIAISTFQDFRTPSQRASSIETVTVRPAADQLEVLGGMTFNQFHTSDPWLYVADPWNSRLMRVDVATGARSTVMQNPVLFNPIVAVEFAPPVLGLTPMFISSDQEHRSDLINDAISGGDIFTPPWRISKLLVDPRP